MVGALGLELWLRNQNATDERALADSPRQYDRLDYAYLPFRVQHLHPQYGFFFPLDPPARVALSNSVVTLDLSGFRGQGPSSANGRKLAFLLGGSTAFGHYATSDLTTITGYLNSIQADYFVVNAGVPSWNSTQEMFRLAYEILDYQPELVITLNGANDAGILLDYHRKGAEQYAIGAPESFLRLRSMIDDVRGEPRVTPRGSWVESLFPAIVARYGNPSRPPRLGGLVSEAVLKGGVNRYLTNLRRMNDMTRAAGGRFVAVFQPVSCLHRHVPSDFEEDEQENDVLARFRSAAVVRRDPRVEFHDLSAVFDTLFPAVPVLAEEGDITPETIFLDRVHLTDRGNKLLAEAILAALKR